MSRRDVLFQAPHGATGRGIIGRCSSAAIEEARATNGQSAEWSLLAATSVPAMNPKVIAGPNVEKYA